MPFAFPQGFRATTLAERARGLARHRHRLPPLSAGQAERARARLARWRAQKPLDRDDVWAARLAALDLSADDFFYLLGMPDTALPLLFDEPPPWLARCAAALGRRHPPLPWPAEIAAAPLGGFLAWAGPLLAASWRALAEAFARAGERSAAWPQEAGAAERLLLPELAARILPRISRALVLELNAARLEGRLAGDTPETRFQSFIRRLGQPAAARALYRLYPVAARLVLETGERFAEYAGLLLERLAADGPDLAARFAGGRDPGPLIELDLAAGDPHGGEQSVALLRFASGLGLVYKPKPVAVERHFQELLGWYGGHDGALPLRTLTVLDRGTYGWVERAEPGPVTAPAALGRFYRRHGRLLALLHALAGVDFHYQNVIAAGEHPLLVDLEALFHPELDGLGDGGDAGQAAEERLERSVLRVGLLPRRRWLSPEEGEDRGGDWSGLAGDDGRSARAVPVPDGGASDEMRVVRRRFAMPRGHHLPTLEGRAASAGEHADDLLAGFAEGYRQLADRRGELADPAGPLTPFAADGVRVLLRPTRVYTLLLAESYHPELLGNALLRDRHFDRLWIDTDRDPWLAAATPLEIAALWQCDVPLFLTRPGERQVREASGRLLSLALRESGRELVARRLAGLSEGDLEQQLYLVRAALATLSESHDPGARRSAQRAGEPPETAGEDGSDALLAAAAALGRRLEALAIRGDREIAWLGLSARLDGTLEVAPLPAVLHHGLAGIALFFAELGAATGEARFTARARETWHAAVERVEAAPGAVTAIGGFVGWGGLLYAAAHLARLWRDDAPLAPTARWVAALAARIEGDRELDVIGGAAGALVGLLRLAAVEPATPGALDAAVASGEHLLRTAQRLPQGLGWLGRAAVSRPISGFSHGGAGIAWALLELAAATGDGRFRAATLDALAYEDSSFSAALDTWPDLRFYDLRGEPEPGIEAPELFPAWCHGAAGIGLARLLALRLAGPAGLPEGALPPLREALASAVRITLARGFGHNHSLCHGDLGNLDILLQASTGFADGALAGRIEQHAARILAQGRTGWRCGLAAGAETPGLMTGLAGIGYGLLRVALPVRVPSVLALALPKAGAGPR